MRKFPKYKSIIKKAKKSVLQKEIAKKTGYSEGYISLIIAGKRKAPLSVEKHLRKIGGKAA